MFQWLPERKIIDAKLLEKAIEGLKDYSSLVHSDYETTNNPYPNQLIEELIERLETEPYIWND